VIWVEEKSILVVCGTSRPRPNRREVLVKQRSPAATVLELTTATFFPESGLAAIREPSLVLRVRGRRVPPMLLHDLEILVQSITRSVAEPAADEIQRFIDHVASKSRALREAKEKTATEGTTVGAPKNESQG
jgi:hypothetical protein